MQNFKLGLPETNHLIAMLLISLLLSQSVVAWVRLLRARRSGRTLIEYCDEPRATWTHVPEITVLVLVLMMLVLHLLPKVESSSTSAAPDPMTVARLASHLVFTAGIAMVVPAILVCSQRPPSEYGLKWQPLGAQVRDGIHGFLLALAPTGILMLATSRHRNLENRNALLTLLSETADPATIALICFAAIVLAPLYEEMLFRVILQGWLTTAIKPSRAIPLVAVAFGAIHGVPDGIALLPLAGVLGCVFHLRHSYVAVLVIHGLFNATMLVLALLIQE